MYTGKNLMGKRTKVNATKQTEKCHYELLETAA